MYVGAVLCVVCVWTAAVGSWVGRPPFPIPLHPTDTPHTHTTHEPQTNTQQEGVLKVCLDMFFKYEWTSVLHQSITRIVTWIMDAGPSRLDLQVRPDARMRAFAGQGLF